MALALEVTYGNAKVYVYDDLCSNLSPEEKANRKKKVQDVIDRIMNSPGADERLSASIEREKLEPPVPVTYIWHREGKS